MTTPKRHPPTAEGTDAVSRLRCEVYEHLISAAPAELEATLDVLTEGLRVRAGSRGGFVTAALGAAREAIRRHQRDSA